MEAGRAGRYSRGVSTSSRSRPPGSRPPEEGPLEERFPSLATWEPEPEPEPPGPPETAAGARGAPGDVARLASEARLSSGDERQEVLARLGARLDALGTGGGSREKADLLLALLEDGQLEGLRLTEQRTARAAAVEALLHLGYPYALEVRPEDLEHLRGSGGGEGFDWGPVAKAGAALSVGAGDYLQWLIIQHHSSSRWDAGLDLPLGLSFGLSLLALLTGMLAPRRSPAQGLGVGVLFLVSLFELWWGATGGYHGQASGVAGILACLLLLLPRR